jgi:HEPN domain-containing protein
MSATDETRLEIVRQWVEKAENDLTIAAHAIKLRDKCPSDAVCFHGQQCIEKYHKAALVLHGVDFPKTHDLNALARLMPKHLLP